MYANTAILEVIERAFFVDLKDEGILFPEYFDAPGIPIVLIALVAAVVMCLIYLDVIVLILL